MPIKTQHAIDPASISALTNLSAAMLQGQGPVQQQQAPQVSQLPQVRYGPPERPFGPPARQAQQPAPIQQQLSMKRQSEGWRTEYTTKQRQELSRINQARIDIWKDPNWDDEMKRKAIHRLDLQEYGISPTGMPPLPNAKKYPDGQGVGEQWTGDDGSTFTRDKDGIPVRQVEFKNTREGIEFTVKAAQEKVVATEHAARIVERRKARIEWLKLGKPILKDGVDTGSTMPRTHEDIEELSRIYFPELAAEEHQAKIQAVRAEMDRKMQMGLQQQEQELTEKLEQELRRRVGAMGQEPQAVASGQPQSPVAPPVISGSPAGKRKAFNRMTTGLTMTKGEAGMPAREAKAQALLRRMSQKSSSITDYEMSAIEEARRILRAHLAKATMGR